MKAHKNKFGENITKDSFYLYLAIPMTIIAIVHLIYAFYQDYPIMLYWYCYALFVLFTIGLWFKNNFLISSAVVGGFVINFLWLQDFLSLVIFKRLNVGIFAYLLDISDVSLFMTLYHPVMLFFSLFILFKQEKISKFAWVGAGVLLLLVSIPTYFSGHVSINCVNGKCDLGIFEPLKFFYDLPIPPLLLNTFFMTLIIFIPTQITMKLLLKWILK